MNKAMRTDIDGKQLLEAWKRTLPTTLNETDSVTVQADEADEHTVRIHMDTAGHSRYSFDFVCTYLDSREVKVDLVDVEQEGIHVDEHTEIIQSLIEDYVRHIHECAQILHSVTLVK